MLTLDALRDRDVGRAIDELLVNATKLAVSGHADIAHRALVLLQEEGPWRLPRHGATQSRYQHLLPLVCGLAGRDCPAVDDRAAMSAQEMDVWTVQSAAITLMSLVMPSRRWNDLAGRGWSADFLVEQSSRLRIAGMADMTGKARQEVIQFQTDRHRFISDAEYLLQARIAEHFNVYQTFLEIASQLGTDTSHLSLHVYAVAPEAIGIAAIDVCRAVLGCFENPRGGSMDPLFQLACLWELAQGHESDARAIVKLWTELNPYAISTLLQLSVVPPVAAWIRSGVLASLFGIDRRAAEAWLDALNARPAQLPRPARPPRRAARTRTLRGLRAALKGAPIADLDWIAAAVDESPGEIAFIARLRGLDPMAAWQSARDLCDRTGRWPVLCCDLDPEQYFSRSEYQQGPATDDVSPAAIIAAAEAVNLPAFLASLDDSQLTADDWLQIWAHEWKALGLPADDVESLWIESGQNRLRCEHLLAERERQRGVTAPQRGRQTCYPPGQIVLMLLPTTEGPDALAYVHWFGMGRGRPEGFVRMLQHWSERYGAELYTHYTTTLEFKVSRPPTDLETALELAREHELVAPATLILPGIALRHYAEGLIDHPVWFLHERP